MLPICIGVRLIKVLILFSSTFFSLLPFWKPLKSSFGTKYYEILWVMSFSVGLFLSTLLDFQWECFIIWKCLFFTSGKFPWVILLISFSFFFSLLKLLPIWTLDPLAWFFNFLTPFYNVLWFFFFFSLYGLEFSLDSVSNPSTEFLFLLASVIF